MGAKIFIKTLCILGSAIISAALLLYILTHNEMTSFYILVIGLAFKQMAMLCLIDEIYDQNK